MSKNSKKDLNPFRDNYESLKSEVSTFKAMCLQYCTDMMQAKTAEEYMEALDNYLEWRGRLNEKIYELNEEKEAFERWND